MKTIIHKWLQFVVLFIVIFLTASLLIITTVVRANPSQTPPIKSLNSTSTTTQAYMTAGTGTTTITYDSFEVGADTKFDQVTYVFQFHSSGTPAVLNLRPEDSNNGIDWYPRSLATVTATTSNMVGTYRDYSFPIATTTATLGGSGVASSSVLGITARVHNSITIDAPMRYVRIKAYLPAGSGPGAMWSAIVPIKEKSQ